MSSAFVETIAKHFEEVTDPRANRGFNYPLNEMVFVALCGAICDCNSWVDVGKFGNAKLTWFRKFLPFELGIPSHDTFSEVFARLDSVQFYAALQSWTTGIAGSLKGQTVAFDGKTLRGSRQGDRPGQHRCVNRSRRPLGRQRRVCRIPDGQDPRLFQRPVG